jgi:hypothetical protein
MGEKRGHACGQKGNVYNFIVGQSVEATPVLGVRHADGSSILT